MEELSLVAELLLLAIAPSKGGLAVPSKARLKEALALAEAAQQSGGRPARSGGGAFRRARAELLRAGLVARHGLLGRDLRLTDLKAAAERFHRVQRNVRDNSFPTERDRELLVLLAWAGALGNRMSRDERRLASRRLRGFTPSEHELAAVADRASIDLFAAATIDAVEFGSDHSGGPSNIEAALGSGH
jgi:hypothetical protein